MLLRVIAALLLLAFVGRPALAADRLTVVLDWFVNPDHAPLFVAEQIGAYKKRGLDVKFIAPADPSTPPREVAAGQADLAVSYQTQIYLLADQGLPLVRVGTLIDKPLNVLVALPSSGIRTMKDFKGKRIGYSVPGLDEALLDTMLGHAGLHLSDVHLVNVNFALVTSLMAHQVDAVTGAYRNFEVNELKEHGLSPVVIDPQAEGVPVDDELILIANRKSLSDSRLPRFLAAVKEGEAYLQAHPQEAWEGFIKLHPDLNDTLNKTAWFQTLPYFAADPFRLDGPRYTNYADFMLAHKLIAKTLPLGDYAVQLKDQE
jgi:putative hydroxymethylpyrimidine transport system substrate-binding protein